MSVSHFRRDLRYHILFWVFIVAFVFDYFYIGEDVSGSLKLSLIECAMYALIAYVNLFLLIPKFFREHKRYPYYIALLVFLAVLLLAYRLTGLKDLLYDELAWSPEFSFTMNYLLFVVISFLYWYFKQFEAEKKRSLALSNEQLKTEIRLLKSQVSPHFLFNSLNNIYALTLSKSDDAPKMVQLLSEILRYLIYDGQNERVQLIKEVEMIEHYLEIHRLKKIRGAANVRFEHRGVKESHHIVPLVLINFVENAFKHGDVGHDPNGSVTIALEVDGRNKLAFSIRNSVSKKTKGEGIGLENVKKQLELNYSDAHELAIKDENETFSVDLNIDV